MPIRSIVTTLAKPVLDIAGKFITDKDKKAQFDYEVTMKMIDSAEFYERQISDRHKFDMQSDSKLSKNIRPLSLAFVTAVFVLISFADGNLGNFSLNEAYIPVYMSLLMMVYGFYFGGRSLEKGMKIYKEK